MTRLLPSLSVVFALTACGITPVHPSQPLAELQPAKGTATQVTIQGSEAAAMIAVLTAAALDDESASLNGELRARSIDCMPESSEHPSSCLVRRDDAQGVHKASSSMATPLYDVLKAHGGLVQGAFMPTKDAVADQVTCSTDASAAECTFTVGLRHY